MRTTSLSQLLVILPLLIGLSCTGASAAKDAITIICDEWPPYQIREGRMVTGFSTQIIKAVFKRMGVTVGSIQVYPWRRAMMLIEDGAVDALFSANYTAARTAFAYYPNETLVTSPWVVWVRKADRLTFDTLDDLVGKKIGVVHGYSYTNGFWNFLLKHKNHEVVLSDEQNFKKLHAGRIAYAVAELGNGRYIKKRLGLDGIVPLTHNPIKTDGLFIVFSKKRVTEHFVHRFSMALKKYKNEPAYQQLREKYLGIEQFGSQK